jgi:hypothetical protein
MISGLLLFVAAGAPISGLIEARLHNNPKIFERSRFFWHLVTNLAGAAVAILFLYAAHTQKLWLAAQPIKLSEQAALNIALPIAVVITLAFVYSQQVDEYPGMKLDVAHRDPQWESEIVGVSLRHVHQLWNVLHLILVGFIGATGILIAACATIVQSVKGSPPGLSVQLALGFAAITVMLSLFGFPAMRKHSAVFWTFSLGMPLCTAVIGVWLSLMRDNLFRDIYLGAFLGFSVLTYAVLMTRDGGSRPKSPSGWYRYTPIILLVELIVVAGGVCRS